MLFPNANNGAVLLQINAISVLFAMLSQTINGILQGMGKSNVPLIAFSIGMIFKFFTNVILVSNESIGIKGAAIGNIICNSVVFFIGIIFLIKNINFKIDKKNIILKPILATMIMCFFCFLTKFFLRSFLNENINIMLSILSGTTSYLIAIVALKLTKK